MKNNKSNLFLCHGIVPTILSSVISEKIYPNDNNIIIVESSTVNILFSPFFSESKYEDKIIDIILECAHWRDKSRVSLASVLLDLRFFSFFRLRMDRHKRTAIKKIKESIDKLSPSDRLIVSDNFYLTRYLNIDRHNTTLMEHGAASYRRELYSKNWKYYVKEVLSLLTRTTFNPKIGSIYLSDGAKSSMFSDYLKTGKGIKPLSYDFSKEIESLYSKFILKFQEQFPYEFQELLNMKKIAKGRNVYIYLPTGSILSEDYQQYLTQQMNQIKRDKNSFFFIKPHRTDMERNYCEFFDALKISSYAFRETVNQYLPVEFLIMFFEDSILVGSFSSSHLYVRWWLGRKTIFTEIKDSKDYRAAAYEYRHTHNDLKQ